MKDWVWFASIKGIGAVKKRRLLEKYKSPEKIFKAEVQELLSVEGITEKECYKIEKSKDMELINRYEKYRLEHGIQLVSIFDENYPRRLKEIYDPPVILFVRGRVECFNKPGIAIVGGRSATNYGKEVSKRLSYELAKRQICIISGMAKGIDAYSHEGALEACGETIAVLGCGVDYIYPFENKKIYYQIQEKGAVISEFMIGTRPEAVNFPIRNRIISGFAEKLVVIEAKKQSGTMITTDFALEQGRDVYVVPGNITSKYSEGSNELIKQGAYVLTKLEDLLERG